MKWLFVIAVCVYGWVGYVQHTHNREDIKETVQDVLVEALESSVGIEGINLPLSYTFLAQEVDAQVFITVNGEYDTAWVTVTPVEAAPLLSVFMPPRSASISYRPDLLDLLRSLRDLGK